MTGYVRWVPARIDMDAPHPARMHDYWLGGCHNFAADRELAEKIMAILPGIEDVARLNQAFLRRSALFLVNAGIRQFLDIGSGIPTVGNLHEIVQRADPKARVVYVDPDPVAAAHTELILEGIENAAVIQGDIRDVQGILDTEASRRLLDLDEPVGLIAPMLHFVPNSSTPGGMLAAYRDRIASGSYLVLAHGAAEVEVPEMPAVVEAYQATKYRLYPRTHAEVLALCDGFELVEPGLVGFGDWRPEGPGDRSSIPGINGMLYVAVGRKP